jgi:hypothetical protein
MRLLSIHENEQANQPTILRPVNPSDFGTSFNWFKWTTTINKWGKRRASDIDVRPSMAFHLIGRTVVGKYCIPGFVGDDLSVMGMHFGLGGSDLGKNRRPCLMTGNAIYSDKKTTEMLSVTDYHEEVVVNVGSPSYQGSLGDDELLILDRVLVTGIFLVEFDENSYSIDIYDRGEIVEQLEFEEGR